MAVQKALNARLFVAIRHGDAAQVERLLDFDADANARETHLTKPSLATHSLGGKEEFGDTALMVAAFEGKRDIAALLIQKGADVNGSGAAGFTPLFDAVSRHHPEVVRLLLSRGARPDQLNVYGGTPLVFAANDGQMDVAEMLLKAGADINGGTAWTPLMDAAYNGMDDMVKFLLARGADPNVVRDHQMTAVDCAEAQGNEELAQVIRKAGGKGRSATALRMASRLEGQQDLQHERAERHAEARRWARERMLTRDDIRIILAVLRDLAAHPPEGLVTDTTKRNRVVLMNETGAGSPTELDDQLNAELDDRQANEITLDMRESLGHRNPEPVSLKSFPRTDGRIVVKPEAEVQPLGLYYPASTRHFRRPLAWVQVFLPGYSRGRERAVLRCSIGPSAHGAAGAYFLIRQGGTWRICWRRFSFYA